MGRAPCCDKASVKKGPWSPEEDAKLKSFIEKHGTGGNWIALPHKIGLKRCGKSCRLRWLNYLRPNLKHGGFSEQEDDIICTLYLSIGSRWSIIAAQLPGRTDNDIKNYWNTKLKKKLMGKQRKADQRGRGRLVKQEINMEMSDHENFLPMEEAAYPPLHIQDHHHIDQEAMMIKTFYDDHALSSVHYGNLLHRPHRDISLNIIHGYGRQPRENSFGIINPAPATSTSVMNSISPSCSPLPANGMIANSFEYYGSNNNIIPAAAEVDDEFEYINFQEKLDIGLSSGNNTLSGVDMNMVSPSTTTTYTATTTPEVNTSFEEMSSLHDVYSHPQLLYFNSQVSQQAIIPQNCVLQDSSRHFGMQHEWQSCTPML